MVRMGIRLSQCGYFDVSALNSDTTSAHISSSPFSLRPSETSVTRYPKPVADRTRIPHWAYLNVLVCFSSLYIFTLVYSALSDFPFPKLVQTADNWSESAARGAGGKMALL